MTGGRNPLLIVIAFLGLLLSMGLQPDVRQEDRHRSSLPRQVLDYKLAFADEFDVLDISPDGHGTHNWYNGVWFNHKHAPLTNMSVSSSILKLEWRRGQESPDTSITTLSNDTAHFKAWRYGYFEARMKWDVVNGAWPAFWLIPVQDAKGEDVYHGLKESGETDIFEGQGGHPHTFYGTIHDWVNLRDASSKNNAFQLPSNIDLSEFHVYGLLWVPGRVTWFLDGNPLHRENTPAIFDKQDFFMVLGMQEGANWKYGDLSGVTSPRMTLSVDWVRVWQR
jgi:hypothetical protein